MRSLTRKHPIPAFFALTFAITWGLDGMGLLIGASGTVAGISLLVAGAGPSLAGLAVSWVADGRSGLRSLLGRFLRWRVGIFWYLLVLVAFPALLVGVIAALTLLSGYPFRPDFPGPWWFLPVLLPWLLFAGPLQEELGWRGFATPALLERFDWLKAGLIVGVAWALWHRTPTTWSEPWGSAEFAGIVADVSLSVVMAWVYRATGGSALLAGLGMQLAANLALATATVPVQGLQWAVAGCFVALALATVAANGSGRPWRGETARRVGRLDP